MTILHKKQAAYEPQRADARASQLHRMRLMPVQRTDARVEFLVNRDGSFPMTYSDECEVQKKAGVEPYGSLHRFLERRVGRKLMARDYPDHPLNETPGTQ